MHRWIAWNILFRLQERLKSHPTFDILRDMEAADSMTPAELDALQSARLRDLIDYAWHNVPYVRRRFGEADIAPDRIRTREDLPLLPMMTKATIREHRQSLRSRIATGLQARATGGSTGVPLIFDLSTRRIASQVACRQRVARWFGLSIGDQELALWGSPIEVGRHDWIRNLRDRLMATRLLSAFEMNEATMSRYLDILEHSGCRQIFAYPSAIDMLCAHAQKEGRALRNAGVRAVFVTGEVLYPHQRERVAATLNCAVADGYGGRDSGFIAHQCPRGGMHVMSDAIIVELLDSSGRPVPDGQPGEIVVTDLYSHEFPFIRYATGDIAVASQRRCDCGRPHPLLERIEGRANDFVAAPDGRVINSLAVIYPVREIEGIEQYKIRQKALDRFHIQIVRDARYPPDAEERIRRAWTKLLRSDIDVTFEYLPALAAEKSGKFRHVISEVAARA